MHPLPAGIGDQGKEAGDLTDRGIDPAAAEEGAVAAFVKDAEPLHESGRHQQLAEDQAAQSKRQP